MKKNYGWVNYKWVVIQNQIVIKLEVQQEVELNLSHYATKKAAKKDFVASKAEVHKLYKIHVNIKN